VSAAEGAGLRFRVILAALVSAVCIPARAEATAILGDTDVTTPTLKVSAKGIALVGYTTKAGLRRHVLAWGALDAVANPSEGSTQQTFELDYSGGWRSRKDAGYWKTFKNGCKPYDGPALPFFVTGCKAADATYWALQAWARNLPMRGFDPWTDRQQAVELHVSHWRGELPELQIYRHWTYGNTQQGFFGRLLYRSRPVFGTKTPSAAVADPWARNIYLDTFDSSYGRGWKHDTAIATHRGNGGFCYSFVPQAPPKGYPSDKPNGNGLGERYRISAIGPGVTPIVQWEGPRLTKLDPVAQVEATKAFDEILGGDPHCAAER
jgi:hypothetical protein